jgi:NitT/TauT family transport system ATP-binding protein
MTAASTTTQALIEISDVTKVFPGRSGASESVHALDQVNLSVPDNEFLMLLGPSGCGKTTLLRTIAGLERADTGQVRIDGKPITGPGPERAMVFQAFALLPWRSVLENVSFGLELRGVSKSKRHELSLEILQSVGLTGFQDHLPKELSGGMQQRVGLARALAVDPTILLMDEPFGALDEQTRRILQEQLLDIWERQRKTVIFVTHSMEEALFLGDRIILMSPRPGRVQEIIENPLPRPRTRHVESTPEFGELKERLWNSLRAMHQEASTVQDDS